MGFEVYIFGSTSYGNCEPVSWKNQVMWLSESTSWINHKLLAFSSSSEEDTETARITGSDLGEAFETAKAAVGNLLEAGFKRDEEAKKQLKAYLAHLFRIPEFVEEELPNSESVLPVESDDASIAAIETQNEVEAAAESDEETSESLEAPLADSEIETAAESTASADSEDEASEGLEVALADSDDEE